MTLREKLTKLYKAFRKRRHNRIRKQKLHQPHKAKREARAGRKVREKIKAVKLLIASPRTMYDSVEVSNIPEDARAVAGYVNGAFRTFPALVRGWPDAKRVSIAVSSDRDAQCLDIEPGDATNADAPGWYNRHDSKRYGKPIFYTSASNVSSLIAELARHRISRDKYVIWAAHFTNNRHVCGPKTCGYPQADGTQYTTSGESLDISALTWRFWNR